MRYASTGRVSSYLDALPGPVGRSVEIRLKRLRFRLMRAGKVRRRRRSQIVARCQQSEDGLTQKNLEQASSEPDSLRSHSRSALGLRSTYPQKAIRVAHLSVATERPAVRMRIKR